MNDDFIVFLEPFESIGVMSVFQVQENEKDGKHITAPNGDIININSIPYSEGVIYCNGDKVEDIIKNFTTRKIVPLATFCAQKFQHKDFDARQIIHVDTRLSYPDDPEGNSLFIVTGKLEKSVERVAATGEILILDYLAATTLDSGKVRAIAIDSRYFRPVSSIIAMPSNSSEEKTQKH